MITKNKALISLTYGTHIGTTPSYTVKYGTVAFSPIGGKSEYCLTIYFGLNQTTGQT